MRAAPLLLLRERHSAIVRGFNSSGEVEAIGELVHKVCGVKQ